MSLEAMFPSEAVVVPMRATSVDEALVELAGVLARAHGLQSDQVLLQLREREQLGSTAIGEGVALPHGRGEVEHTVAALGISPQGILWGEARVHVVVALLSPRAGREHIEALAKIGRRLTDGRLTEALRGASSPTQARELLVGTSQ
jgi:PTS system nitrogen regulatory IIA component